MSPLEGDCEDQSHQHISSSRRPAQGACSPHSLGLQHPVSGIGVTEPRPPDPCTDQSHEPVTDPCTGGLVDDLKQQACKVYLVQVVDSGDVTVAPRPGWCRDDGVWGGCSHACTQERVGQRQMEAQGPAVPPGCPFLILVMSQGRPRLPSSETGAAQGLATWKEA